MEILQPYNKTTLQLISDELEYQFDSTNLTDGIIKLAVYTDIGSYLDGEDLQQDIDFYVKDNEFFIKPNEYLDRNGFFVGNHQVDIKDMISTLTHVLAGI